MNRLLKDDILESTGISVDKCYQCGKCSAGCPLSEEMDYPPSVMMRMLQTSDITLHEKALRSYTAWVCLSCETCYSRCPMSIDIPKIMDCLREKSLRERKTNLKAKKIISFHKSFLKSVRLTGRLYELGLMADYKIRTYTLLQDMNLAPRMFAFGKLKLIPELVRDRSKLTSVFSKTLKKKQ